MIQWITGILAATLLLTTPAIPAHGGSLLPHRRTHHRTYGSSTSPGHHGQGNGNGHSHGRQ